MLLAGLVRAWQLPGLTRRLGVAVFGVALAGAGGIWGRQLAVAPAVQALASDAAWQPWSPERVQTALRAGRPVLVDYTASWCITCQFNKKNVFEQAAFLQLAREHRLVLLRADWTRHDPVIAASLRSLGRAAVPSYAIHRPQSPGTPLVLTELLSLDQIRQALAGS